jgi:hypothetical protein
MDYMVDVLHKVLTNPHEVNEKGWSVARHEYQTVATGILRGDFDSLHDVCELAYRLTQNITPKGWALEERAWIWKKGEAFRSSKVGDRFIVEGGLTFEVASVGFEEVTA